MSLIRYLEKDRIDPISKFKCSRFVKDNSKTAFTMHCHDYYELLFFPESSAVHFVNDTIQNLPRGSLVLIRPDDYHDVLNSASHPTVVIFLAFSNSIIQKMFEYLSDAFPSKELLSAPMPPYVILDSFEINEFQDMLSQLNSIDYNDKETRTVVMRSLLAYIFTKNFLKKTISKEPNIPEWLISSCNNMKQLQNFSVGLDKMVEISGRSKEHLCRSMQKFYGITAMEFINDIKLTYVANMLIDSNFPIIDIFYESGYTNLSWAYSLFKKKYGISPAMFRKANV